MSSRPDERLLYETMPMPSRPPSHSRVTRAVVVSLLLATLVVPPAAAGEPAEADPAAESLLAAEIALHRAASERDRAAFAASLAADAVFFAETEHRGRDAFLAGWAPLWTAKYDFHYRAAPLAVTVAQSGEIGFAVGEVETRFQRPGLDTPEITAGHYLAVWRREADDAPWELVASATLVVHPRWGAGRDPRSGLMTAWPELADRVGAAIDLEWRPETTVRAASGELAYSLGDYRVAFSTVSTDADAAVSGAGRFLAAWERDERGHWQLLGEGLTPPALGSQRPDDFSN